MRWPAGGQVVESVDVWLGEELGAGPAGRLVGWGEAGWREAHGWVLGRRHGGREGRRVSTRTVCSAVRVCSST